MIASLRVPAHYAGCIFSVLIIIPQTRGFANRIFWKYPTESGHSDEIFRNSDADSSDQRLNYGVQHVHAAFGQAQPVIDLQGEAF